MTARMIRRPVLAFLLLAFSITWGLDALGYLVPLPLPLQVVTFEVAGAGPSLAGLIVVVVVSGRQGVRALIARMLRWRTGWRWWLLVVVVFPVVLITAEVAAFASSGRPFSTAAAWWLLPALFPLVVFLGPLQEEVGWRGFALPTLLAQTGWVRTGVLLGLAWALWHRAPSTWASITWDQPLAPTGAAGLVLGAFVPDIALSVLMAWVFTRTGSGLLAGLGMHTAANFALFVPAAPVGPDATEVGWAATWAVAGVLTALAALVVLAEQRRPISGGAPSSLPRRTKPST